MSLENKKPDIIEYEALDILEESARKRGRWVYNILKIIIGVLLYKVLFAAVPYFKSFIKDF
jgi:hypothetical protein